MHPLNLKALVQFVAFITFRLTALFKLCSAFFFFVFFFCVCTLY